MLVSPFMSFSSFLSCADLADADAHPRVFGLPLPIAILAIFLSIPLFGIAASKVGGALLR